MIFSYETGGARGFLSSVAGIVLTSAGTENREDSETRMISELKSDWDVNLKREPQIAQ